MVDLNRVATFVEVVARGGFSAAARALGLPVSSVSRSVAKLEQEIGTQLLQRTTRRLAPTEAGQAFFERARALLQGLREAEEAAGESGTVVRGAIRLTAPADAGGVLAPILAGFLRVYPEVRLDLLLTGRTVDLVEEGVDLAIRAAARLQDSALVARKVVSTPLQIFASPDYLAARGEPRTLADLARHDVVMLRRDRGDRMRLSVEGPRGPERVEVAGRISVDEVGFAVEAAVAGLGIVLAPLITCRAAVQEGKLRRILRRYQQPGAAMWLVHPGGRQVPLRVARLRDHLAAELAKLGSAP